MAKEVKFKLKTDFKPSGDQPEAIKSLVNNIRESNAKHQVLLGVTGSGKTFTMANTIQELNRPALILAPNKTLAAQLYAEFKDLFPENAVEYFVSYYDYYQPEAYVPSTDTFIEKDSAINEQIDRMRHSATRSLLDRKDVIIISSVSCIYGLGSPDSYKGMMLKIVNNTPVKRDKFLRELVRIQYKRSDVDFVRGGIRVRGDIVEIFPPYEENRVIRVEFFGDHIDKLSWIDPLSGEILKEMDQVSIYPGSHYVTSDQTQKEAITRIQAELQERLAEFKSQGRNLEAQRLEQRTYFDIEMMEELGYCNGIENYSRHLTGREPGAPPPTLIEYFPEDFLLFVDESHVMLPQIGGMYRGDRARKMNLVEHGFRLPSALDNRPLNFQEFEALIDTSIYVSATPGDYEMKISEGLIVEQLIRPTGLIDPLIEIRPIKSQVDDILEEVKVRVEREERVLITTLTKKSSEDLTNYYTDQGIKVKYLHSDIKTIERTEILRDLRLGVFDVLIGINLLREGLDIPEVSLVAITEADKEGFLRSQRSLIQTIGRAARNSNGKVILYADRVTDSMERSINETLRRRKIQESFNKANGITPTTVKKRVRESVINIYDPAFNLESAEGLIPFANFNLENMNKSPKEIEKEIAKIRAEMKKAATELDFELASKLRDDVKRLELIQLTMLDGVDKNND